MHCSHIPISSGKCRRLESRFIPSPITSPFCICLDKPFPNVSCSVLSIVSSASAGTEWIPGNWVSRRRPRGLATPSTAAAPGTEGSQSEHLNKAGHNGLRPALNRLSGCPRFHAAARDRKPLESGIPDSSLLLLQIARISDNRPAPALNDSTAYALLHHFEAVWPNRLTLFEGRKPGTGCDAPFRLPPSPTAGHPSS